jgi:hypothetical protein
MKGTILLALLAVSACSAVDTTPKSAGCGVASTQPACSVTATSKYTTECSCHIAGYLIGSNVIPHSMLDLDQKDLETAMKGKLLCPSAAPPASKEKRERETGRSSLHRCWD